MAKTKETKTTKPRKYNQNHGKGGVSDLAKKNQIPDEDNIRLLQFQIEIQPPFRACPLTREWLEERWKVYCEALVKYNMRATNRTAYFCLGLSKTTVADYINGRNKNPEVANFLKGVRDFCSAYRENSATNGNMNPVLYIFQAKNYDGMSDQQQVVVTSKDPLGDKQIAENLEKKYLNSHLRTDDIITVDAEEVAEKK